MKKNCNILFVKLIISTGLLYCYAEYSLESYSLCIALLVSLAGKRINQSTINGNKNLTIRLLFGHEIFTSFSASVAHGMSCLSAACMLRDHTGPSYRP